MLRCPHPHVQKYAPVRAASQALQLPLKKNFTTPIYKKPIHPQGRTGFSCIKARQDYFLTAGQHFLPQFLSAVHLHLDASQALSLQQASFLQVLPCEHSWASALPQACLHSFLQQQVHASFVHPSLHLVPSGQAHATFLQTVSQATASPPSFAAGATCSVAFPFATGALLFPDLQATKLKAAKANTKISFLIVLWFLIWFLTFAYQKLCFAHALPFKSLPPAQKP